MPSKEEPSNSPDPADEDILVNMLEEMERERPGILEQVERKLQASKQFEQAPNQPKNNPETS